MGEIEMSATLHVPMRDLNAIVQSDARVRALLGVNEVPRDWELARVQEDSMASGSGEITVALFFTSEKTK